MPTSKEPGSMLPEQAVNAIEQISGTHPGCRRAHAKGICCEAVFRPSGAVSEWTAAPHLQQEETRAIVRFSNTNPDPDNRDLLSPAKGLAVQFLLPDGARPVIVAATTPVFFARTPESFLEMMQAFREAKRGGISVKEIFTDLIGRFPHAKSALASISALKPPASFASRPYYSIHAFYFVDGAGKRRPVKYEWIPDAGEDHLPLVKAPFAGHDYLEKELAERLESSPVGFTLRIVRGEEWDPVDDPTTEWPRDRETVDAGQLIVTRIVEEPEGLLMDPTVTGNGIEVSEDPILRFRKDAYAVSFERRSQGI
ncbi:MULTISPECIES: catalase family peroxidase [unclassified Paenibacillus]|uniref:catalase family peroxidase n=1 Tax=unclassified Paenibacillus TaxID=185978 RepID=UPI000953F14C|nr:MULTISPECIES: catalase family peroxidase [unclassified Paenibacillus]ASS68572.2 catalase family peroxidase [Paenibacillus sp. RUD330]SIR63712.1 catalase [Paenibacillus sp. RU4X]SIR71962.1 catalase [Paenibacillus sp. RU4T]